MVRLVCTTLAVLLAAAQAVTPVEKVLNLLEDLKKEIEEEGKNEAKQYDKFACFCKDATKEKSDSIMEAQDKIDELNAEIEEKTATKEDKTTKREEEQALVEETTTKLEKTTEQYEKDKATYEATHADLTKAVVSSEKAHDALKNSDKAAAFLDLGGMRSEVQNCLDLADALSLVPESTHKAVGSFLQVDPDDPAYKFHSEKILEIIKDLHDDFTDQKNKVQEEWEKTDETFKKEKEEMEETIATAKDKIEELTGEIDELTAAIAKDNEDLVLTTSALTDDSTYLKDLTVRCEARAKEWDQRTQMRHDEAEAISKAVTIMEERVVDNDKDANKRALLIAEKPAVPVAKAAPKATEKVAAKATKAVEAPKPEAKKPEAKKSLSFLQVGRAQDKVIAMLRQEGKRLDSTMLSTLAEQIAADPFKKIKKLIQGLITRLLEESKAEATKKGFCDTELGKARKNRDNRYADIQKLDANIADLEASRDSLKIEIEDLTEDLKELRENLKEATELRTSEKEANEETIKKSAEGEVAVTEALGVLKEFYESSKKAKMFLQVSASPVDEDAKNPGAGFEGSYRGSQGKSKSILGLLEVIKSDFERTNRVTTAEEKEAQAEFVKFQRSSKSDIAAKDTKKALDEQDLESTENAIDTGMEDLQTATDLLDKALENIEELKPTCIDTGMSYAERVKKREEEIDALKNALEALKPE